MISKIYSLKDNTRYILVALVSFVIMLSSCSDDIDLPEPPTVTPEDGYITLTVNCQENATRATEDAIDELNENLINSVVLCLWPSGGDHTDTDAPTVMMEFNNLNATQQAILRVPLNTDLIMTLFKQNDSNSCQAFVAVNVDKGDARTVSDLRNKVISSTFASQKIQNSFTMDGDGTVLLYENRAVGEVNVRRSAAKVTLHLNVDDKITDSLDGTLSEWTPVKEGIRVMFHQGVAESTLDPKPALNMDNSVYFDSDNKLSYQFQTSSDTQYPLVQDIPFYTYPNRWKDNVDEHRSSMTLMVPWTKDGGKTFRNCYYQVPIVPLTSYETIRNTSYHVRLHVSMLGSVVNKDPIEIEADYYAADWGKENMDVDIKDYRYLVVDSNNFTINNAEEISIPFYTSHPTSVDKASVKMKFWRFNFSDEGTAFEVAVSPAQNNKTLSTYKESVYEVTFDNETKCLILKHPLKVWVPESTKGTEVDLTNGGNTIVRKNKTQTTTQVNNVLSKIKLFRKSDVDEYSKVEFEITVWHDDLHSYSETVKITQYPGIYIETVKNYVASNATSFDYSGIRGNTQINGNTSNISASYASIGALYKSWNTSIGLSTGYLNWNPNLYLVTITKLPYNTEYIIGDPRAYDINNNLSNSSVGKKDTNVWTSETQNGMTTTGFISAPAIGSTTNRRLKYYYPTIETNQTKFMIAPKIRVCSSYGGTSAILTREMARRRAAAYQELGYAAGRWRLPTFAEVRFLMEMSRDNKIPRLFGRNTGIWYYWCAQGAVKVPQRNDVTTQIVIDSDPNNGGYGTKTSVFQKDNYPDHARFVYDEWYWGSETLPASGTPNNTKTVYTFTWGDKEKTNPEQTL